MDPWPCVGSEAGESRAERCFSAGLVMVLQLEGTGDPAWWGQGVPRALPPCPLPRAIFKPVCGSLYTAKLSPAATAGEGGGMLCLRGSAGLEWWHHSCTGEGGMVASQGQGRAVLSAVAVVCCGPSAPASAQHLCFLPFCSPLFCTPSLQTSPST